MTGDPNERRGRVEDEEVEARAGDIGAEGEPEAAGDAAAAESTTTEPIDYKDRWLRAEAELQNFRRRARRELDESRRFAEERVLLEIISFLDDLERAIEAARDAGAPGSWLEGVQLVARRMGETLERMGVRVIHPVGEKFDPTFHEALLEIDAPSGSQPGHVVEVVRKGYRREDRAVRPARVVVARLPAAGDA